MITKEELTVLSRQYAVNQAEQGDEFISAGKGFLAGFNAGIEEMRAENARTINALSVAAVANNRLRNEIRAAITDIEKENKYEALSRLKKALEQ